MVFVATYAMDPSLTQLLAVYEDVFEEPKGISHDHYVLHKECTASTNIIPHRYLRLLKDIFEKIIREMLQAW